MKNKIKLINKSIGASLLISLGNYALLKLDNSIGSILFALGLLGVCFMELNLFTGKCGFLFKDKVKLIDLSVILIINLISGYLIGLLYSFIDVDIYNNAIIKVDTWSFSLEFFIKSILCGIIMYIAVYMYKEKKTSLGIIYGIPLFIFCGFQHCIANIITLGIARNFDASIILCILGNFIGSLIMWYFSKNLMEVKNDNNKSK